MADSKEKASVPVETPVVEAPAPKPAEQPTVAQVDQGSPAQLEEARSDPNPQMQAEVDKPVGEGENLYFFPDIQKSVVAKSFEQALQQVQADLDAFKQQEGNK